MVPQILVALQLASAAGQLIKDISSAISTAQSEGRDLTPDEMAALLSKKQSADDLAAGEAARLKAKHGL